MLVSRRAPIANVPSRLSTTATSWAVAGSLAVVYVLSTLPTPLYVVYRRALGFSTLVLTLIYAAYVVGSIGAMFFFGRLSDQVGRRPVVLAALGAAAVAVALFLAADGSAWLFAARVVSGFSIALASGACTAWIVESQAHDGKRRGTRIAIGANLLGLGIGPLIAGVLAQYAPAPLRLPYLPLVPLLLGALAVTWLGEETLHEPKRLKEVALRPRFGVPRAVRTEFLVPAISAFATFAVLGFYAALVPSLLQNELRQSSRAIAGGVSGGMFLVATLAAAITTLPPVTGVVAGLALLIPGLGTLVLAEQTRSMALLLLASAAIGVASGFGYRFGVELVNELAPEDHRSEVVSAYLIVCYGAISLPVIGVGLVSAATSALTADTIFGALVAALAIAALAIELVLRVRRGRARA